MNTEYEMSSRLIFWGDNLKQKQLAQHLNLSITKCVCITKGMELKRSDGTKTGSIGKTGMLSYTYDEHFPEDRRNPVAQLNFFSSLLGAHNKISHAKFGIESSEIQIFFYYKNSANGDVDFYFPDEIFKQLHSHSIALRITILP